MSVIELIKLIAPVIPILLALLAAWRSLKNEIQKMSITGAVQTEKISTIEKDISLIQIEVTDIRTELHRHAKEDAATFADHGARITGLEKSA